MKALLLAAGLGTRLRPLTDTIPKCLVPIHGTPLLGLWLTMLDQANVGPFLVNLHYKREAVEAYLAASHLRSKINIVYEGTLLGTAGTVLKNKDFFQDGAFMLIHADNLSVFDVQAFIRSHQDRPSHCDITMMTFDTDTPHSCGIVELDQEGVVQAFHEKVTDPPGTLANGAVYILEPAVIQFLTSLNKEIIDFSTEVLPHYLGRIFTFKNDLYHRDIGTMTSYNLALEEITQIPRPAGMGQ